MNDDITACCYRRSTDKFEKHDFKCSNKNKYFIKEPYLKVYAFMTVINEDKLLFYGSYLYKIGCDTMNC